MKKQKLTKKNKTYKKNKKTKTYKKTKKGGAAAEEDDNIYPLYDTIDNEGHFNIMYHRKIIQVEIMTGHDKHVYLQIKNGRITWQGTFHEYLTLEEIERLKQKLDTLYTNEMQVIRNNLQGNEMYYIEIKDSMENFLNKIKR